MTGPCRTNAIEAQATHHHREPTANVVELVEVDAREAAERFLHHILRLAGITEGAPRQADHSRMVVTPHCVEARPNARRRPWRDVLAVHGSSTPPLTVVIPMSTRQPVET